MYIRTLVEVLLFVYGDILLIRVDIATLQTWIYRDKSRKLRNLGQSTHLDKVLSNVVMFDILLRSGQKSQVRKTQVCCTKRKILPDCLSSIYRHIQTYVNSRGSRIFDGEAKDNQIFFQKRYYKYLQNRHSYNKKVDIQVDTKNKDLLSLNKMKNINLVIKYWLISPFKIILETFWSSLET